MRFGINPRIGDFINILSAGAALNTERQIKKYVEIPELTHTIVNELVKKIIVSAPDKSSGKRRQRIKIIFNFVGDINIPILTDETTVDPKYIRKSKGAT